MHSTSLPFAGVVSSSVAVCDVAWWCSRLSVPLLPKISDMHAWPACAWHPSSTSLCPPLPPQLVATDGPPSTADCYSTSSVRLRFFCHCFTFLFHAVHFTNCLLLRPVRVSGLPSHVRQIHAAQHQEEEKQNGKRNQRTCHRFTTRSLVSGCHNSLVLQVQRKEKVERESCFLAATVCCPDGC